MIYDFSTHKDKLFNSLFYKLKNCKSRIVVNYGGAGSGKSVAQHQLEHLLQLDSSCNFDTLFVRKNAADIYDSCFTLLKSLSNKYDTYEKFNWVYSNSKRQIENKETGHRILFKGMDDSEKLKSIVGIKRIVVEEASQLDFADFLELNRRARGFEDIQIFLLLNPININHWIKTKIIDHPAYRDDLTVFKTTYKDNKFLTDQDRKELERLKDIDENQYNIYALGEWGIDDPNKLFAKDYSPAKHFGKSFESLYQKDLEIFLAWDFNVDNTCYAIQNYGNTINVLKEYHIKGYDLQMLCKQIKKEFPNHEFIINGDASGNARSALTTGNATAYNLLHTYLGFSWDFQFKVPKANPSHLNSRFQTNVVLKFCDVNISSDCKELDMDLRAVEVDDNGSMNAYKTKHPERTHYLDCFRYHLNAHHKDKLRENA